MYLYLVLYIVSYLDLYSYTYTYFRIYVYRHIHTYIHFCTYQYLYIYTHRYFLISRSLFRIYIYIHPRVAEIGLEIITVAKFSKKNSRESPSLKRVDRKSVHSRDPNILHSKEWTGNLSILEIQIY